VPVIERLNSTLIAIMQGADALGYKGRYAKVAPVVDETFDLVFMASKSIGRYWKALEQEQRARWVDAFRSYTVSNFADRFDGFSGQTFEILGQKKASHATVLVLTQLVRPTADDVELNYRMRDEDGAWRVVDIYSGGKVSEVALRRSEYASVLKQGGIEKLIAVVNAKAESRSE
jgi:phospholipid transport system substrate-binding protein